MRIYDVFHMSLLEKDTTRRRHVDNKALSEVEKDIEIEIGGDKEYEVKVIIDYAVYNQQANNNQMPGFYYLVLWKGYLKEQNTQGPSLAVIHLRKLISTYHKEHTEKPTATSPPLNFAPPIAKPMVPKKLKQKCGRLNKRPNKRSRN